MYPRQSPTTHTEQLGEEASVYDWARAQVHALNPTAARVWRQCDGATSPDAIAAALRVEMGIPEADAVVDLTLRQLARLHLLELPVELARRSTGNDPALAARSWRGRGDAAGDLLDRGAVSRGSAVAGLGAPTLTQPLAEPGQPGHHGGGHADRHQLRHRRDDGHGQQWRRDGRQRDREQRDDADRQHCDRDDGHARCPLGDGHDGPRDQRPQTFTVGPAAPTPAPTLTSIAPNQGSPGHDGAGHTDGHQLRRRRHDGRRQR